MNLNYLHADVIITTGKTTLTCLPVSRRNKLFKKIKILFCGKILDMKSEYSDTGVWNEMIPG